MQFYHVCTKGDTESDSTIHLKGHRTSPLPVSEEFEKYAYAGARSAFTEGLTPWGREKLWEDVESEDARHALLLREWIFEMYRRDNGVQAPSRFQSLFACETLEEARKFFFEHKQSLEEAKIYEVHTEQAFGPFYLEWLNGMKVPAMMYWEAENYWGKVPHLKDGNPGPAEYLIPLPCKMGDVVETVERN